MTKEKYFMPILGPVIKVSFFRFQFLLDKYVSNGTNSRAIHEPWHKI